VLYEKITSTSSTLDEVKSVVHSYPQILSFSFSHVFPLDKLCMKKTSNPDIIIYLVQQGAKIDAEEEERQKRSHSHERIGDMHKSVGNRSTCTDRSAIGSNNTRGGLVRDMRSICMPPLKWLIYNDRMDVLKKLSEMDPPMLLPQDVVNYHLLHFAVSHCRPDWVRFFLDLNPRAVGKTNDYGQLPIHLCAKEWHKSPDIFWDVFRLLLVEGVKEKVGGEYGFGGLFVPTLRKVNAGVSTSASTSTKVSIREITIIEEIFKSAGVTWDKISKIIQDKNARNALVHQLLKGNISGTQHFIDIVHSFSDCLCVKDGRGQLPIHIALERGIAWDNGTGDLVKANSTVIKTPDKLTGLFPFALAAVGEGNDLESIFELLRRFPEGVPDFGLPPTATLHCHDD